MYQAYGDTNIIAAHYARSPITRRFLANHSFELCDRRLARDFE